MKKLLSAMLSAAMITGGFTAVYAEDLPESDIYTVDNETMTVSGVEPLTSVQDFLDGFATNGMTVVNIDGSEMPENAYATDNTYLMSPSGELYSIRLKYAYNPIEENGAQLEDSTLISGDIEAAGFAMVQTYGRLGSDIKYDEDNINTNKTKITENGEPVYLLENNSDNYSYLRSHYTESTNYSTELQASIGSDALSGKPIVTTVTFEADKLGTVSVFHNVPIRNAGYKITRGDSGMDNALYSVELPYAANSVHFTETGDIKLGGMYTNYGVSSIPAQETGLKWVPGKKYTVSIVQRFVKGGREGYIDGVYVNGSKIFPNDKTIGHADGRVALQEDGSFKIGTRSNDVRYGGGISSIMVGTVPRSSDETLTVRLSDVKIYTPQSYNSLIDADISMASEKVRIDNDYAEITYSGHMSVQEITDSIETDAKLAVFYSDGTKALSGDDLASGMYVKAVSEDGLASKTYSITETEITSGFFSEGNEITALSEAEGNVSFQADVPAVSGYDGQNIAVIAALYNKESGEMLVCAKADGIKNEDEITRYTANIDMESFGYDTADLIIKGFVWDGLDQMKPIKNVSILE